jgi:hypothetical protein
MDLVVAEHDLKEPATGRVQRMAGVVVHDHLSLH